MPFARFSGSFECWYVEAKGALVRLSAVASERPRPWEGQLVAKV